MLIVVISPQVVRGFISSSIGGESGYTDSWYGRYDTSRYSTVAANCNGVMNTDALVNKSTSFLAGSSVWNDVSLTEGNDYEGCCGVFESLNMFSMDHDLT